MSATDCKRPGMRHRFDYFSGWCTHGCGVRDDERVVNWAGSVIQAGPEYGPQDLEVFRTRLERKRR